MPELPEVETVAAGLRDAVLGAEIASVAVSRADYVACPPPSASAHLVGRTIEKIGRHGKLLRIDLSGDGLFVCHLGMSGKVIVRETDGELELHTHLRLGFAGRRHEVHIVDPRRFGGVWIDPGNGARVALPKVGPDALAVRLAEFRRLLSRGRQIKALLLDQSAIAGLGNIYCDEALFAAGVHPLRKSDTLSDEQAERLLGHVRRILRSAIRAKGSTLRDYRTATGETGGFQRRHLVYGREGEPCPRCGRKIRRILVASRSSHVCTRCQPTPRAARSRADRRARARRGS